MNLYFELTAELGCGPPLHVIYVIDHKFRLDTLLALSLSPCSFTLTLLFITLLALLFISDAEDATISSKHQPFRTNNSENIIWPNLTPLLRTTGWKTWVAMGWVQPQSSTRDRVSLACRSNTSRTPISSHSASLSISLMSRSLVTLAIQNAAVVLIMHYSRISTPSNKKYSAATAVLLVELLKGTISFFIAYHRVDEHGARTQPPQQQNFPRKTAKEGLLAGVRRRLGVVLERLGRVRREVFSPDCWKLSIPAILYGSSIFHFALSPHSYYFLP